jgi:hypothetical protein
MNGVTSTARYLLKNVRILGGDPTDIRLADGTVVDIAPGLDTSSPSGSDYSTNDAQRRRQTTID